MAFSHKTAIVDATEALEQWAERNKSAFTEDSEGQFKDVDWDDFREVLNTLNPEIHECEHDDCLVETWKGASDFCPACKNTGVAHGRLVYNYTPKNPRGPRSESSTDSDE